MKLVAIDELKGNEILAEPVMSASNRVLMHADIVLKDEYIKKLKSMDVEAVYVKDEAEVDAEAKPETVIYTEEETYEETKGIVEGVLSKHIYKHNDELRRISEEADVIIEGVLAEPEVLDTVTEIRNISTDMYSHCINVCILSTIMALRLRMNERQVKNVSKGAILHDIGLKYISAPYIDIDVEDMEPEAALDYKKHTVYGYSSIQEEEWLSEPVKEIILLHHEQVNGKGYPFKQSGSKLKNEVKLVSLCDDFDALISGIGSKRVKVYEAIENIKAHIGIKYDPTIAGKFIETVAAYPVGVKVCLSNGEIGEVIKQNREALVRPVLRILNNSDGTKADGRILDMVKQRTVFIVDTL